MKKKKKNQLTIHNNSLNQIKLKEINLNKYTKYIQFDGKKNRVNKYVLVTLQVEEQNNRDCRQKKRIIAQKNYIIGINYEIFDIYIYINTPTLHVEKFYMNKKSKAN